MRSQATTIRHLYHLSSRSRTTVPFSPPWRRRHSEAKSGPRSNGSRIDKALGPSLKRIFWDIGWILVGAGSSLLYYEYYSRNRPKSPSLLLLFPLPISRPSAAPATGFKEYTLSLPYAISVLLPGGKAVRSQLSRWRRLRSD